jgi:hypothetical protein
MIARVWWSGRLGVADEQLWPVPSLDLAAGIDSSAVALFVERAQPGLAAAGLAEVEPVPSDGRDGVAQRLVQRSEVVVARLARERVEAHDARVRQRGAQPFDGGGHGSRDRGDVPAEVVVGRADQDHVGTESDRLVHLRAKVLLVVAEGGESGAGHAVVLELRRSTATSAGQASAGRSQIPDSIESPMTATVGCVLAADGGADGDARDEAVVHPLSAMAPSRSAVAVTASGRWGCTRSA